MYTDPSNSEFTTVNPAVAIMHSPHNRLEGQYDDENLVRDGSQIHKLYGENNLDFDISSPHTRAAYNNSSNGNNEDSF